MEMYNFQTYIRCFFEYDRPYNFSTFLIIIIVLRLSAEGEVFYFQERLGFIIPDSNYKFATMLKTL